MGLGPIPVARSSFRCASLSSPESGLLTSAAQRHTRPELARFLIGRGHAVQVVTMASAPPTERPCPVTTIDSGRPFPLRYGELTLRAAGAARQADVVYASATYAAAAIARVGARRPLVAKLVSDPAYERARRWRLFEGTLEEFQQAGGATADWR